MGEDRSEERECGGAKTSAAKSTRLSTGSDVPTINIATLFLVRDLVPSADSTVDRVGSRIKCQGICSVFSAFDLTASEITAI